MATDFDKYAARGNEMLNALSEELHVPPEKSLRILRSVLHAIRDHLTVAESMQALSQLPMILKAVYVDQWNVSRQQPRIHHVSQFLDEIREHDKGMSGYDFGNNESAQKAVRTVLKVLSYYISEGEFQDLIAVMPEEIKKFMHDSLGYGKLVL